jgi:hypothetical protein
VNADGLSEPRVSSPRSSHAGLRPVRDGDRFIAGQRSSSGQHLIVNPDTSNPRRQRVADPPHSYPRAPRMEGVRLAMHETLVKRPRSRPLRGTTRARRTRLPPRGGAAGEGRSACRRGHDERGDRAPARLLGADSLVVAEALLRGAAGRSVRSSAARSSAVFSPPEEIAQVKAIACALSREHELPLPHFSRAELHRLVLHPGRVRDLRRRREVVDPGARPDPRDASTLVRLARATGRAHLHGEGRSPTWPRSTSAVAAADAHASSAAPKHEAVSSPSTGSSGR